MSYIFSRFSSLLLVVSMAAGSLFADVLVSSASPGWTRVYPGATWVLPTSALQPLGDMLVDPPGVFQFNKAFATPGMFTIFQFSEDQAFPFPSDRIYVDNNNTGGIIGFASDFSFLDLSMFPNAVNNNEGFLCNENPGFLDGEQGCTSSFTLQTVNSNNVTVTVESGFRNATDPLGSGLSADDGISFQGASALPEPSFFFVLPAIMAVMLIVRVRRCRKRPLAF